MALKIMDLFKSIKWAKNGDVTDMSQTNYEAGWSHLGDDTPTVEDFNLVQKLNDEKDQWLFNQIKAVCDAKGIAITETDNQALLKAINTSATLSMSGITQLSNALDSISEEMAATPKAIKTLKDLIDALTRNLGNYIPNSKKSNAVDSNSADTVATSFAVKTSYDKGVEAKTAADNAQQTASNAQIAIEHLDSVAYKVNKSIGYAGNTTALMQENTVFSTTDGNLLGLPPTAYKWGAGVSMSTNGGKALLYVAHSGSQVWAKGGYAEDYSQEWKRLDGADWTEVRGRPSSVNHYGFSDFDIGGIGHKNLNDIIKPGMYGQYSDSYTTPDLNHPINQSGTLLVTPSAYGIQQEYTTYYSNHKYVRGKVGDVWQPWRRIDGLNKLSLADFTQHFGSNGWCRLPNGLILQWGEFANCYTDSDRLLHFPIAFPTACLYVGEGKVMSPRTSTIERVQITDYSASGFYASTAQVGRGFIAQDTLTFSYFAIGY